ncbi:uncharacterized protein A1O9_11318 [Exophiala aquamarina CBS 119918]|uniref:AMP-dependent synthetase/ligase domain-containing protein n=1 Tax=Exophiala aquamarina CBS 119918 TaxID=1182545 RepID=A0A072NXY3_9EURO|nr:uncharacterized protein A1O9_11318 [Exophiala aquamarina CBS 119918]KEF52476.1 hypothetical protein A1O9_11318 [Exophiala aquamarina CBS 119918]
MTDRANFVPRQGNFNDNVLPNDPLFLRLLTIAHGRHAGRPLIRDINAGLEATAHTLLSDVLTFRQDIVKSLAPKTIRDLDNGRDVLISLFAEGGYEFSVAILAVLALGACASLLSIAMPTKELTYYIEKTHSVMILASKKGWNSAKKLEVQIRNQGLGNDFVALPISIDGNNHAGLVPLAQIFISSGPQHDPNGPGTIIFTSGTTGPPKAVVLRRSTITTGAQSLADQLDLQATDTLLHPLPVHHATGVNLSFFPFLQAGACIEFKSGGFDSQWIWDRLRQGGLTHFTGVPTIYMRLMRHWEKHISHLPPNIMKDYRNGAANIKVLFCGTAALSQAIDRFWKELRGGHPIVQRYGSSETQIVINMPIDSGNSHDVLPDGSVGKASVGVELKIAGNANQGELLVKSPHMFSCYLNDKAATLEAHDDDGYYKTGDIASRAGDYYLILGRADIDIVKSGGYKISALDIEREMLGLSYVNEAMVIGVPDDEFGQRVAAVVAIRKNASMTTLTLDRLRMDLRSRLAGYKLPTLLRVVDGELPKNATEKVVKKKLGPLYFPPNYREDGGVQIWKTQAQKEERIVKL